MTNREKLLGSIDMMDEHIAKVLGSNSLNGFIGVPADNGPAEGDLPRAAGTQSNPNSQSNHYYATQFFGTLDITGSLKSPSI